MVEKEKPFAYSREDYNSIREGSELTIVSKTLADVVMSNTSITPGNVTIHAWFPDGKERISDKSYSKALVKAPSREEALAEIENVRINLEKNVAGITHAELWGPLKEKIPPWYELGAPLEDQIKKYTDAHKKETCVWLSDEEIKANAKTQGWA